MAIGFIGLGLMGSAMCTNLLKKSGETIVGYDQAQKPCEAMSEMGVQIAKSSAALAGQCDVIFSMLPKNEHVRAVYEEVLTKAKPGTLLIEMSTISPEVSRELARLAEGAGCEMIDAPVVKSRPAALTGTLGIYVGGSDHAFERARPLLAYLGSNILHLGPNGAGLVMKLCHNALVGQIQNGVNEMLLLANRTMGIDVQTFAKAVSYGGGQNFYLDSKKDAVAASDFTTAFSIINMNKDVHLARDLMRESGLALEGLELICRRYEQAMEQGLGNEDFCATYKLFA